MKYDLPDDQGEVLPNLLGLKDQRAVELAEAEGFLSAEITLYNELSDETGFDLHYIKRMHHLALGHLYAFAGEWRTVNMSKGGFNFPSAKFLNETMHGFEREVLKGMPDIYTDRDSLIRDMAKVHGEFLFIHPFREGNGRTARLLADLMAQKQGYGKLRWASIGREHFEGYVMAVQQSAIGDPRPMEALISSVFPG